MPKWLVKLKGEEFDLKPIAELLRSVELKVIREGENYYLTGTVFNTAKTPDDVRGFAKNILRRANAAERVRCGSSLPIQIDDEGVLRIDEDGSRRSFFSTSFLHTRNVRQKHSPVTEKDASAFAAWIQLAGCDPEVDKAFRNLIEPEYSYWLILYNIFEVIEGNVGKRIDTWGVERKVKLFSRTAQMFRHSRQKSRPPKRPMSLEDGGALIRTLLRRWLNSKLIG